MNKEGDGWEVSQLKEREMDERSHNWKRGRRMRLFINGQRGRWMRGLTIEREGDGWGYSSMDKEGDGWEVSQLKESETDEAIHQWTKREIDERSHNGERGRRMRLFINGQRGRWMRGWEWKIDAENDGTRWRNEGEERSKYWLEPHNIGNINKISVGRLQKGEVFIVNNLIYCVEFHVHW